MKKRLIAYPAFVVLMALAWMISSWMATDADEELFQSISGPTVKITIWHTVADAEGSPTARQMGHGTGVIIAREKYAHFVLSAAHVSPEDAEVLRIEHPSFIGSKVAKVLDIDREHDLMLLVFIADSELPVATIASREPSVTADVFLYGHGAPSYAFATKGILSAKQSAWFDAPEMWVVTSQVWFGCSGGGSYNRNGEFIGVVTRVRVSNGLPLSWQCGIVPLPTVKVFLKKAGMAVRKYTHTELAGTMAGYGTDTWRPLLPIYPDRQGDQ